MSLLNNGSIHWCEEEREATELISVWTSGVSLQWQGGLFESAIYQLRPNQNQASSFHMLNVTFASSQLDLLKLD